MSDGKLFTKAKPAELKLELEQAFKKSKPHNRIKIVLRKLIANIILNNNEMAVLMPEIIPLLKIDDLEIRKLVFNFIGSYAPVSRSSDLHEVLPYLNTFQDHSNPILRALAIKLLSGIAAKEFIEASFKSIKHHLNDLDSHVRKISAFAVAKLFQFDRHRAEQEGLVGNLNALLYDSNQTVVSSSLAALGFITEQNKTLSLTLDKEHAFTLISLLSKSNEWSQVYILNSLMLYTPQTDHESLDLIEAILPCLQHENSSVVLNSIKLIVYYCNYVKNPELVIPSLPKRLGSSLTLLLLKPSEIQFLVLRNVILLLLGKKELISIDVQMFFCRYDDPIYVKDTKLEIIYLSANESNFPVVLRELEEYATEVDISMARKAIRAFGNLAVKLPAAANSCVEIIIDLISNGISYIIQESCIILKNILRKYPGRFNFAINDLIKHYKLIDEPDAKTSIIWIIGQYCELIPNSATILDHFISNFVDDPIEVQYATLTAATKYYLTFPQAGEQIILKVLKWATEEVNNPDIRDRGYMYWRLLSTTTTSDADVFQEKTKSIVIHTNPLISAENDKIDPHILEELELNIGSLASIYLKPVQHVFRLSNRKTLTPSPALRKRKTTTTLDANPGLDGTNNKAFLDIPDSPPDTFGVQRGDSMRSGGRRLPLPREASFDSGASSDHSSITKKESMAQRITRKASVIANRKSVYKK